MSFWLDYSLDTTTIWSCLLVTVQEVSLDKSFEQEVHQTISWNKEVTSWRPSTLLEPNWEFQRNDSR